MLKDINITIFAAFAVIVIMYLAGIPSEPETVTTSETIDTIAPNETFDIPTAEQLIIIQEAI